MAWAATMTLDSTGKWPSVCTGQCTYVWKTDRAWKGTCRVFRLGLNDSSDHTANCSFN
ncbi:PxKF domain-containing protein [Streptomyces sp. NPDC001691]|uniref:PxKF domain-containing protein n=1 Tax=Streptomyces sp. NPDC001691 TaxID=3364600 RepID=UPI0036C19115